jgi:hypothetical protein
MHHTHNEPRFGAQFEGPAFVQYNEVEPRLKLYGLNDPTQLDINIAHAFATRMNMIFLHRIDQWNLQRLSKRGK